MRDAQWHVCRATSRRRDVCGATTVGSVPVVDKAATLERRRGHGPRPGPRTALVLVYSLLRRPSNIESPSNAPRNINTRRFSTPTADPTLSRTHSDTPINTRLITHHERSHQLERYIAPVRPDTRLTACSGTSMWYLLMLLILTLHASSRPGRLPDCKLVLGGT
jgi:hypothetical protein